MSREGPTDRARHILMRHPDVVAAALWLSCDGLLLPHGSVSANRLSSRGSTFSAAALAAAAGEQTTACGRRSGQIGMQFKWPGADGGHEDFFPKGGPEDFDPLLGPLRRQILAKSNPIQGKLGGYSELRPAMKRAFAAVSVDGTDNGWITSSNEFITLMMSVSSAIS